MAFEALRSNRRPLVELRDDSDAVELPVWPRHVEPVRCGDLGHALPGIRDDATLTHVPVVKLMTDNVSLKDVFACVGFFSTVSPGAGACSFSTRFGSLLFLPCFHFLAVLCEGLTC